MKRLILFDIIFILLCMAVSCKEQHLQSNNGVIEKDDNDTNGISYDKDGLLSLRINEDSVFSIIESKVGNNINGAYNYDEWEANLYELYSTSIYEYNDFDWVNIDNNIIRYLNWHLTKQIALNASDELINGIKTEHNLIDNLLRKQYELISVLFIEEDNRYAYATIENEILKIRNDNLKDLYFSLTDSTYRKEKNITTSNYTNNGYSNAYDYNIYEDWIESEYKIFTDVSILYYDDQPRTNLIKVKKAINNEVKAWSHLISQRKKIGKLLYGVEEMVWRHGTEVIKLNKIRQLKNEFQHYGVISREKENILLSEDCTITQLHNYTTFSNEWRRYEEEGDSMYFMHCFLTAHMYHE